MSKKKMTQKEAIRLALGALGKDAKNSALADWCKENHGIALKPNGVSGLKGAIRDENKKRGPGRPPKSKKAGRRNEITETVKNIRALIAKFGAAEVKQLVNELK